MIVQMKFVDRLLDGLGFLLGQIYNRSPPYFIGKTPWFFMEHSICFRENLQETMVFPMVFLEVSGSDSPNQSSESHGCSVRMIGGGKPTP